MSFATGKTGGEYYHALSVSELAQHTHIFPDGTVMDGAPQWRYAPNTGNHHAAYSNQWTSNTGETGGGNAHNNIQPYIVTYFWKRIA